MQLQLYNVFLVWLPVFKYNVLKFKGKLFENIDADLYWLFISFKEAKLYFVILCFHQFATMKDELQKCKEVIFLHSKRCLTYPENYKQQSVHNQFIDLCMEQADWLTGDVRILFVFMRLHRKIGGILFYRFPSVCLQQT